MQIEITKPGPLLSPGGSLASVGWARQPILDCNLENAQFYKLRFMQLFRVKALGLLRPFHTTFFLLCNHRQPGIRRKYLCIYDGSGKRGPARRKPGHSVWKGHFTPP